MLERQHGAVLAESFLSFISGKKKKKMRSPTPVREKAALKMRSRGEGSLWQQTLQGKRR